MGIPDLPFLEAVAWFRARVPMTDLAWEVLVGRARRKAFHVAGLAQLSLVQTLYDAVTDQLENGVNEERFQALMLERLSDAWGEDVSEGYRAWRIRLVLRQELTNAFNAGRYRQATDPVVAAVFNRWLYSAVMDGNTTEVCKKMDGTILPQDDPFWDGHHPPLHIGCRGSIVPLMEEQANEMGGVSGARPNVDVPEGFGATPGSEEWEPEDVPGPLQDIRNRRRRELPEEPAEPAPTPIPVRPVAPAPPLVSPPREREHAPGVPNFDGGLDVRRKLRRAFAALDGTKTRAKKREIRRTGRKLETVQLGLVSVYDPDTDSTKLVYDQVPPQDLLVFTWGDNDSTKGNHILTRENAVKMVEWFEDYGNKLVVDYEHDTFSDVTGPRPAAGWITKIWLDEKGMWFHVEWTQRAQQLIMAKEYCYVSPAFEYDLETNEIVQILPLALVNFPATKDMVPLVASAKENATPDDDANQEPDIMLKFLIKMLGLKDDATEADVMAALSALSNEKRELEGQLATLTGAKETGKAIGILTAWKDDASQVAQLKKDKEAADKEKGDKEVDLLVAEAIDKKRLPPAKKAWALKTGKAGKEGRAILDGYLEGLTPMVTANSDDQQATDDQTREAKRKVSLKVTPEEKKIWGQMGLSAAKMVEIKKKEVDLSEEEEAA